MNIKDQLYQKIPDNLKNLVDLAYNLWWSYQPDARELFQNLDPPLWFSTGSGYTRHNPVYMLRNITPKRLEKMSNSKKFMKRYEKVMNHYNSEIMANNDLWWNTEFPKHLDKIIAYLSMEYGLHGSLPIYSGGLGVLAGDHIKEASDLGIPIVAVGFLYQEGYFDQRISASRNGWQEELFREHDFNDLPIQEVLDPKTNTPLIVSVNFKDEMDVNVKVWRVDVGRVPLYLLDSNIEENVPWYRDLTDRLYGGGSELRLQQEIILGYCSVRLLDKLGINPTIYHLNEGHCSFSSIERIRKLITDENMEFKDALEVIRHSTLFTTHTPVPAGHDVFDFGLINAYFNESMQTLGKDNFCSLGAYDFGHGGGGFNMTALGLRTSLYHNAVARLHRETSDEMFKPLFSELKSKYSESYNPLEYVTNGTHVPSFVGRPNQELFSLINENWIKNHDDPMFWKNNYDSHTLTDYHIWEYHKRCKTRLFRLIRETARKNRQNGLWDTELALVNGALLDPDVLTIGFARRFATYKRANLIFTDLDRLKRIVNDPYHPVQFIFAGKAHPRDDAGKHIIQQIYNYARNPELGYRIAFLENYDLIIAKLMLQGCDVWLNNPVRPNEASGTSGMKASMNFLPNFSILDGWWPEAHQEDQNGWAINSENITYPHRGAQDWNDAKSIYDLLETKIIPLYYDFEPGEIPFNWIQVMRQAHLSVLPQFSARRMLKDYSNKLYVKLMEK
ncbi:MAG: alpha-glucan family phosphorylase [Candidatus Heimdallarchaeota archaeon]|nr:MAG: alpha-glucan family phosphorylase [Candidatus Heimdallarchaeota archaeon]